MVPEEILEMTEERISNLTPGLRHLVPRKRPHVDEGSGLLEAVVAPPQTAALCLHRFAANCDVPARQFSKDVSVCVLHSGFFR
jgi:hypothetical protein